MQARGNPRVALVTGAARRLGRAIALALARDGWDIAVHYGSSAAEAGETAAQIRGLGRRAGCFQARLDAADAAVGLIDRAVAELGPITALINNASHFVHDDAATVTAGSLNAHLQPNLVAPILLAQGFARHLEAAGDGERRGVIVNLLDQKLFNLNPDFLSYTVAKAGLAAATTMLAQALAPAIRIVGVAPGLTLPSYLQDEATFRAAHARFSPLGASSTVDDVAASVVFAVANQSITGSVLLVDGGQHLLGLPRDASLMPAAAPATATAHSRPGRQ
ncbi:MAG: SDR family oxidoreductase [Lautropia sp.]